MSKLTELIKQNKKATNTELVMMNYETGRLDYALDLAGIKGYSILDYDESLPEETKRKFGKNPKQGMQLVSAPLPEDIIRKAIELAWDDPKAESMEFNDRAVCEKIPDYSSMDGLVPTKEGTMDIHSLAWTGGNEK